MTSVPTQACPGSRGSAGPGQTGRPTSRPRHLLNRQGRVGTGLPTLGTHWTAHQVSSGLDQARAPGTDATGHNLPAELSPAGFRGETLKQDREAGLFSLGEGGPSVCLSTGEKLRLRGPLPWLPGLHPTTLSRSIRQTGSNSASDPGEPSLPCLSTVQQNLRVVPRLLGMWLKLCGLGGHLGGMMLDSVPSTPLVGNGDLCPGSNGCESGSAAFLGWHQGLGGEAQGSRGSLL